MVISIINGPNLNLQGYRQPEIYGYTTFEMLLGELAKEFPDVTFDYFQSNSEGAIIDRLHRGFPDNMADAVVINPGGYSHTSVAIADAIRAVDAPVYEVHISNIHSREPYRRHSITGEAADGVIAGCGIFGYKLAIRAALHALGVKS